LIKALDDFWVFKYFFDTFELITNHIFKKDRDMLFSLYDLDGSGAIAYKEFASAIFNKQAPSASRAVRSPEELAEVLRNKLVTRGARGFIGLQRQFRIMDDNNSRSLDKYEFSKAMIDYQLGFTEGEIQKLFNYFDFDHSGFIEFDEFIRAIRGPMNAGRKAIVLKAFAALDKDGSGWIDINDIKGVYTADKHPDVISGKKTTNQILQEFLETFETAHSMRNNNTPNYVVTKEEFEEYYNNISASIDDDSYFDRMIKNAWKLDEESRIGQATRGWGADNTSAAAQSRPATASQNPQP
jgi:Ca2+-binding EF-hand superfamily protein